MCDIFFKNIAILISFGVDFIKGNFDFLEKTYSDLFELADGMEKTVYNDPDSSTMKGNKFLELIIESIYDIEGLKLKGNLAQDISRLKDFNIISYEIREKFNNARRVRNNAVHSKRSSTDKEAFRLAALLYSISVWFYKKYGNDDSFRKAPPFNKSLIVDKNNFDTNVVSQVESSQNSQNDDFKEDLEDILNKVISDKIDSIVNTVKDSKGSEKDSEIIVDNDNKIDDNSEGYLSEDSKFILHKYNGSYLLNELLKLKKSSKEAVENSNGFNSYFKNYMHVNREIQDELYDKLMEVSNNSQSHLIMLAGSVGDGKSHLLSFMKNHFPDLMNNFTVINDATESLDPNLTALQTLRKRLSSFNDKNINNSNKKLILAINLGILSNFFEDENISDEFSILKSKLNKINIFDASSITDNITDEHLSIINFADYKLYELDEEKVSSNFISELIIRITNTSENNPFYAAYKKDIDLGVVSPVIYNYQMFMNKDVQKIIVDNLIKCIIQNKMLTNTREILNFFYEILVPSNLNKNYDMTNFYKYVNDLLPCLFFNTENRSKILKNMIYQSPINLRNDKIDQLLISLNTLDMNYLIDTYFDDYPEFEIFKHYLLSDDYNELNKSKQNEIKRNLLYFASFFGKNSIKNAFVDEIYNEYIKYLYNYNYQGNLRHLFLQIEKSIFKWKGSIKNDYIIIDNLPNFDVSKKLSLDFRKNEVIDKDIKHRFKDFISFNFLIDEQECMEKCTGDQCNFNNCVNLKVDYLLFEIIYKINKGYRPNKNEKENLLVFNDFIDNILIKSKSKQLLLHHKEENKFFKFKKSSGNYYSFAEE